MKKTGYTRLMIASAKGNSVEVEKLLRSGAPVNEKSIDGFTALIFAAAFNRKRVVQLLLKAGARTGFRTVEGDTAFSLAAARGFWSIAIPIAQAYTNQLNRGGRNKSRINGQKILESRLNTRTPVPAQGY